MSIVLAQPMCILQLSENIVQPGDITGAPVAVLASHALCMKSMKSAVVEEPVVTLQ